MLLRDFSTVWRLLLRDFSTVWLLSKRQNKLEIEFCLFILKLD